jgi:hypothetical protein
MIAIIELDVHHDNDRDMRPPEMLERVAKMTGILKMHIQSLSLLLRCCFLWLQMTFSFMVPVSLTLFSIFIFNVSISSPLLRSRRLSKTQISRSKTLTKSSSWVRAPRSFSVCEK